MGTLHHSDTVEQNGLAACGLGGYLPKAKGRLALRILQYVRSSRVALPCPHSPRSPENVLRLRLW